MTDHVTEMRRLMAIMENRHTGGDGGKDLMWFVRLARSEGEFVVLELGDDQLDTLYAAFDGVRSDDVVDFDEYVDTVERGYLFNSDGYRGQVNYEGLLRVDGVWCWADLVSEGTLERLPQLTDDTVQSLLAPFL